MKLWEKLWCAVAVTLVAIATLVSGAGLFNSILSIVGILFVLGVTFKRPESQILGAIFTGLLGVASFSAGFYANAFINCFILVPISVYGYILWKKRGSQLERSLDKKAKWDVILYMSFISIALAIVMYGIGGTLPILDSITAVMPVIATLLMVFAFREQWLVWIPYNALQAFMWFTAASLQPAVLAVFVLKVVFLINSLIGYYQWRKISK